MLFDREIKLLRQVNPGSYKFLAGMGALNVQTAAVLYVGSKIRDYYTQPLRRALSDAPLVKPENLTLEQAIETYDVYHTDIVINDGEVIGFYDKGY